MNFDPSHIAVPFRMQPGLRRMAPGERHFTPLHASSPLATEKQAVVQAGQHLHALPGFDAGPALRAIGAQALADGIGGFDFAEGMDAPRAAAQAALAFEEDLAVLDGETGRLTWLCICTPSHWAPEEKLGLDFAAVHMPVADAALLRAASGQLVALATGGAHWERFVWTVSPSARHDQHPLRQPRTPWPAVDDVGAFAAQCHLRTERQTLFPVGHGTRQAVFTIRVMLEPLTQAAARAALARRLHDSLASMSDAVLDYKNLAAARQPLLAWLARRF